MFSDKPIARPEDDELGYGAFAARLVKPLVAWPAEHSLVVGLYGGWGTGKSSVLNLLHAALLQPQAAGVAQAIPIRFNPWLYRDTESLLISFFATLAAETKGRQELSEEERETLGEAFAQMGEALEPVLSLGESAGGWFKLTAWSAKKIIKLGQRDIFQRRKKAEELLRRIGSKTPSRRVVVLIDDLDRLEPGEVRATLKLVKLLADLPFISYVLAMDQHRVAALIDRAGDGEGGLAYLEKIVQLPVYLPNPSPAKVQELVEQSLQEVVGLDPFDVKRRLLDKELSYQATLGRRIGTLRDRARLINNLRFLVRGGADDLELYPLDAVLVSLLQTFYPEAYERVRRNRSFLTDDLDISELMLRYAERSDNTAKRRVARVLQVVTGAPGLEDDAAFEEFLRRDPESADGYRLIRDVIAILFPYVSRGEEAKDDKRRIDRRENRIVSPDRFDRYFSLQPPIDEVSDQLIDEVVGVLQTLKLEDYSRLKGDVRNLLEPLTQGGRLGRNSILKLTDRIPSAPGDVSIGIGLGALAVQDQLDEGDLLGLLSSVVEELWETEQRQTDPLPHSTVLAFAELSLNEIDDPCAVVILAEWYSKEHRRSFQEPEKTDLATLGARRMRAFVEGGGDVFASRSLADATNILWRWRDLLERVGGNVEELRAYLRTLVTANANYLPKILAMAAGWGVGTSLKGIARNTTELRSVLTQLYPFEDLLVQAREYALTPDREDPHGLLAQFIEMFEQPDSSDNGQQDADTG